MWHNPKLLGTVYYIPLTKWQCFIIELKSFLKIFLILFIGQMSIFLFVYTIKNI